VIKESPVKKEPINGKSIENATTSPNSSPIKSKQISSNEENESKLSFWEDFERQEELEKLELEKSKSFGD